MRAAAILVLLAASGPALAQTLPETSRAAGQAESLNQQMTNQGQLRAIQQQNQFEINQLRAEQQRNAIPPATPGTRVCPPGAAGC